MGARLLARLEHERDIARRGGGKSRKEREEEEEESATQECVGDNAKGSELTAARQAAKVEFAVDVEARAEPTKQNQRAPIKMESGRAWSPGIYQALRLLGKTLDVAWERSFIHPLTFN